VAGPSVVDGFLEETVIGMPLALLALGLLVVVVAAVLAGYGLALWAVVGLAVVGAKVLLELGLIPAKVLFTVKPAGSGQIKASPFADLTFAALKALTYVFPVFVSLVLLGIDTGRIYPALAPYGATILGLAKHTYGVVGLRPIGPMTLTRLIEIVLGAQAIWAALNWAVMIVYLIISGVVEAAGGTPGSVCVSEDNHGESVGATPAPTTSQEGE